MTGHPHGYGIEEDDPNRFCAAVKKRCQYYSDLLEIFSDHASVQPQVSLDQMGKYQNSVQCLTINETRLLVSTLDAQMLKTTIKLTIAVNRKTYQHG